MNKQALSCFSWKFLSIAGAAAAVMIAAAIVEKGFAHRSPIRIGLALLQGLASAVVIIMAVRSIRRLDELQQKIQLEALAFSFAGTGVLTSGYGFLVDAGLPDIEWGALVWPFIAGLWAIGLVIANRRYR